MTETFTHLDESMRLSHPEVLEIFKDSKQNMWVGTGNGVNIWQEDSQQFMSFKSNKNVAAIMHGSTFLKYFFPLGNFFAPLLLWTLHKDKPFLNYHGKQALNFQLSILVYALGIGILSLPFVAIFASDFVGLAETLEGASHYDHSGILPHLGGYLTLLFVFAMLFIGLFLFQVQSSQLNSC